MIPTCKPKRPTDFRFSNNPTFHAMGFLRVFARQGLLPHWLEKEPPLAKILQCFDIQRNAPRPDPISVFSVRGEGEEMEAAAAVFQISPSTPEKRFGVIIDERDCREAKVPIDWKEPGMTGIRAVDRRHANLIGNQEGLASLVAEIVKRMWEGEQRLRTYPAQQIAGQLAVFSKLAKGKIDANSRGNCLAALNNVYWHKLDDKARSIEIRGKLDDAGAQPITAVRFFGSFFHRILSRIRGK